MNPVAPQGNFRRRLNSPAFTLAETLMSLVLVGVVAGIAYTTLNTSMMLYGKNLVVNLSQQSERYAMDRVAQAMRLAISSSLSAPQLINATGNTVSGNGPSAGVRLYLVVGNARSAPPMLVNSDASASDTSVVVETTAGFAPSVGDRLLIPTLGIEKDVSGVSGSSPNFTLVLSASLGKNLSVASGKVVALFARKTDYVVQSNGSGYELRCYNSPTMGVVVRNVTTQIPFSRSTDGRFINVAFATKYDAYSRQGTNQQMLVTNSVPCRTSLPLSQ